MKVMKIMKIIGIAAGAFAGLFVLLFFLFPRIHPERAEEVGAVQVDEELLIRGDRLQGGATTSGVFENLKGEMDTLRRENDKLRQRLDSITLANDSLVTEMTVLRERKEEALAGIMEAAREEEIVPAGAGDVMGDEELSERVKSLLNLDEEELAGIVKHLDEDQLLLLYRNSGNIQREKLLRSLEPDRAAKLMRTVMS